ncbi:MAG: NAD(P)/FAD-dependent oxidoreductase [Candidatus Doudnabacteria bacterium]|nr:NAD(P)/FAD-dependent oxidoreductase [Candidatus Doudnabacteria bacterium]
MNNTLYDVAVIGAGPAGLIAAGRANELGAKVVLIEKNVRAGEKLSITGGGRCNITNAELDVRKMVSKYGPKGKALFGAFARFGVEQTMEFFVNKNLPLKIEAEKRAFPVSNKAQDVLKVLLKYLGRTEVFYKSPVSKVLVRDGKIEGVVVKGKTFQAKSYIITTGGKSRPETGSSGEMLEYLKKAGHTVKESDPALVPVKIKDKWVKELQGLNLKEVGLTIFQDNKKQESRVGKMLFTHFGISGPLVLNMSKSIAELFKYGPVTLELDLFPLLDIFSLDRKILESVNNSLNKKLRNMLGEIVAPKFILPLLELAGIDSEKEANSLTKQERSLLAKKIKTLPMTVEGFLGVEKAIITSGGVSLKEVDFKTMRSKVFSNLYLAGDILDFDRPSGGFSLQICWTTGYLAGENAATLLS